MEEFFQLEAAWTVFMGICAAIIAVGGAALVITRMFNWQRKPSRDNSEKIAEHDTYLASDKRRIETLERQQVEMSHQNKMMLRALMSLLDHEIDGDNHRAALVASRDEIHGYLYDKIDDVRIGGTE